MFPWNNKTNIYTGYTLQQVKTAVINVNLLFSLPGFIILFDNYNTMGCLVFLVILKNFRFLHILLASTYCLMCCFPSRMKREHNKKHIEQAVIERQKVAVFFILCFDLSPYCSLCVTCDGCYVQFRTFTLLPAFVTSWLHTGYFWALQSNCLQDSACIQAVLHPYFT